MRISIDTNVILRLLVRDDERQTHIAVLELERAETVIISLLALSEAVWVMTRRYGLSRIDIAEKLRAFVEAPSVECDVADVEAGLAMLEIGGDFADGVIASQGRAKRADTLVTFDRRAVNRLTRLGQNARLATGP